MAKKVEERIFYRPGEDAKPLPEELRKKLFPNVPPPGLRELKERLHQKKKGNEKN